MFKRRITKSYYNHFLLLLHDDIQKIVLSIYNKSHNKYNINIMSIDDMISLANFELLKAMIFFDPNKTKTPSFRIFLWIFIYNMIKNNSIKFRKKYNKIHPIDNMNLFKSEKQDFRNKIFINEVLSILTKLEKRILVDSILGCKTLGEIGEELQIQIPVVHSIKNDAIFRIRKKFPNLSKEFYEK